jgi:hypothetical protein
MNKSLALLATSQVLSNGRLLVRSEVNVHVAVRSRAVAAEGRQCVGIDCQYFLA